jgi:S-DNA-T family DNA segregation ATPase FtsK/SpoIIIE
MAAANAGLAGLGQRLAVSIAFVFYACTGVLALSRTLGVLKSGALLRSSHHTDSSRSDDGQALQMADMQTSGMREAVWDRKPHLAPATTAPMPPLQVPLDAPFGFEPESLPRILTQPQQARGIEPETPQSRHEPSWFEPRQPVLPVVPPPEFAALHASVPVDPESFAMARRFAPAPALPASQTSVLHQQQPAQAPVGHSYVLPSMLALGRAPASARNAGVERQALHGQRRLLEEALKQFGVAGRIVHMTPGPVVSVFELETARGVNAGRVIALADEIAAALDCGPVRIAAIPASERIGIEVPTAQRDMIGLRELLETPAFRQSRAVLPLALGRTTDGEPLVADLVRLPHLLIAGRAGSGKTSLVDALVLSMLYRLTPDRLRLLLIDPGQRDLPAYATLPHNLGPVAADPRKAVAMLAWLVREVGERAKRLSQLGAVGIEAYNAQIHAARRQGTPIVRTVQTGFDNLTGEARFESEALDVQPMPHIVVVIAELADLMQAGAAETEAAIRQIAQSGQQTGVHLIVATGRCEADVLTRTIKGALAARLCLKVDGYHESMTVLGDGGAAQLTGAGDMLYGMSNGRIIRLHGPLVTRQEVGEVVRELARQPRPQYPGAAQRPVGAPPPAAGVADRWPAPAHASPLDAAGPEQLLRRAIEAIRQDGMASASHLQRRLGIPYDVARDVMTMLEARGLVGRPDVMGKRQIRLGAQGG